MRTRIIIAALCIGVVTLVGCGEKKDPVSPVTTAITPATDSSVTRIDRPLVTPAASQADINWWRSLSQVSRNMSVLNTAYATYKDNFMTWSADAYVVKSSDLSELKKEIERVLAKRSEGKK